jgi:hypothetical protein
MQAKTQFLKIKLDPASFAITPSALKTLMFLFYGGSINIYDTNPLSSDCLRAEGP